MRGCKGLAAAAAAALVCLAASTGWAQTTPNCSDTTMFPNPIYITGSTAYQPTAALFAVQMATIADPNLKATIIYQNGLGSCDGPASIMSGSMLTGTAAVWSPGPNFANDITNVTKASCTLDNTHTADVGASDIFWDSCPNLAGVAQPTTIKDFPGPVQAMLFVVSAPQNTAFTAMSAEAAQLIWGCGMGGMVSPFTDNNGIMQRNANSGTQGIVAKAINVPPTAFFGAMNAGGGDVLTSIKNYVASHDPTKAIGFVAADLFDLNSATLFPVALRGFNQNKAYYADSSRSAGDRKNVRDGHYVAWGPEHFFVTVDSTGAVTSPAAAKFLGATSGTMFQSNFDYVNLQSRAGVVPQCAMQVTRTADGGPILPKTDNTDPCGCFYEKVRTGLTSCTACPNGNADCTGGKTCHHGYCE